MTIYILMVILPLVVFAVLGIAYLVGHRSTPGRAPGAHPVRKIEPVHAGRNIEPVTLDRNPDMPHRPGATS